MLPIDYLSIKILFPDLCPPAVCLVIMTFTGWAGSSDSPFIFNPSSVRKAEGQAVAAAAAAARMWCAGGVVAACSIKFSYFFF